VTVANMSYGGVDIEAMASMFDEMHEDCDEVVFDPVSWSAIVAPGSQLHVLHGGDADPVGVHACVHHLQHAWPRAPGVVFCRKAHELRELAGTTDRVSRSLIVCVSADAIADAPADFNILAAAESVTIVVTQSIATFPSGAELRACAPYSRRSGIIAVILPSCRLSTEGLPAVMKLYQYPDASGGAPLERPLRAMPHDTAIVWTVGASSVSYAAFGGALANPAPAPAKQQMPYQVDVQTALAGDVARSADAIEAQHDVERAWFWCKPDAGTTCILPVEIARMETIDDSPFVNQRGTPIQRLDTNVVRFASTMDMDEIAALMTSHSSDVAAVRTRWWDVHFLDAVTGAAVPAWLSLETCSLDQQRQPAYSRHATRGLFPAVDPATDDAPWEEDCVHPSFRQRAGSGTAPPVMEDVVYITATCILATPGQAPRVTPGIYRPRGYSSAVAAVDAAMTQVYTGGTTATVKTTFPSADGRGKKQ
jgi:hypothetical protein